MSADLVAFVRDRLAEDEQAARAATQGRWFWAEPDASDWVQGDGALLADQGEWRTCQHYCTWSGAENLHRGESGKPGHEHRVTTSVIDSWGHDAWGIDVDVEDAAHIVRWDPAQVLRDVEAKRAIVDRLHHEQEVGLRNTPDPEEYTSCVCGWEQVMERGDYDGPYERHLADLGVNDIVAEAVLRLLALPYADHPGYRAEEWAP